MSVAELLDTTSLKPVDIELLVQWALQQTGYLPWRAVLARELAYDHHFTAIPKNTRREFQWNGPLLRRAIGNDANAVLDAIKHLPPRSAALVIKHGRDQTRPEDFAGIEPRKVWHAQPRRKKGKKKRTAAQFFTWDIHPDRIAAAREVYGVWHAAMARLANDLPPLLENHRITGFSAKARPWEQNAG